MIPLAELARCFEGEIPCLMATCSAQGEPNLAHLSRVYLVDDEHVATSNQFLTKTAANLVANPMASLLCVDPLTVYSYKLLLCHERTERDGALFEDMRRSIELIASLTGMTGVFALRAAEVFRVLDAEAMAGPDAGPGP